MKNSSSGLPCIRNWILEMYSVDSIEPDKSSKHELTSVERSSLLPVSSWCCASISVSYIRHSRFKYQFLSTYFTNSVDSTLFRKNSFVVDKSRTKNGTRIALKLLIIFFTVFRWKACKLARKGKEFSFNSFNTNTLILFHFILISYRISASWLWNNSKVILNKFHHWQTVITDYNVCELRISIFGHDEKSDFNTNSFSV